MKTKNGEIDTLMKKVDEQLREKQRILMEHKEDLEERETEIEQLKIAHSDYQ